MKNDSLTTQTRVFVHAASFKEGIVPLEDARMDVGRALKDLPPEDARKMKRRFRKLWRKLAREEAYSQRACEFKVAKKLKLPKGDDASQDASLPLPPHKPSKRAKLARKELVRSYIFREHVYPMNNQFTKIERDNQ